MTNSWDNGITPSILLDHMRVMERRLSEQVDSFRKEVHAHFNHMDRQINLLFIKSGNFYERLDDIEVVQLPKVRKHLRRHGSQLRVLAVK
ncbi:MAG: hypothetical protein WCG83_03740 [Candidatus Peregrinibacteria bacterium]